MGLAEDFAATAPAPRDVCHACDRLADLDGTERQALETALNQQVRPGRYAWAAVKVQRVARANGLLLPEGHVREHRNEKHAG